jgi:hypothetical protein
MSDGYLIFDDGLVKLGDEEVPGILKSLAVRGSVRFDEAERDGLSGKVKTPMGWEDADVCLVVELLTDENSDCYDKLSDLNALFVGADNGGNPKVYDVVNRHLQARGLERVVFAGLESMESDRDDVMFCAMSFTEHTPVMVEAERRVVASQKAMGEGSPLAALSEAAPEPEIDEDLLRIGLEATR